MADPYSKIRVGDHLDGIPGAAWNSFLDTAQWAKQQQQFGAAAPGLVLPERGVVALIRNDSGEARERFDVLSITGVIIDPANNLTHFQSRPTLTGNTPDSEPLGDFFAVLQEPLGDGKIGRALVAGITAVQLDVTDTGSRFADLAPDENVLRTQQWGCCPILWKESGTGTKWAYVTIGSYVRGSFVGRALSDVTNLAGNVTVNATGQYVPAYPVFGGWAQDDELWVTWDQGNSRFVAVSKRC